MPPFQFDTENDLVNAAIPILKKRGWRLQADERYQGDEGPPITTGQLARKLGVRQSAISVAVRRVDCPPFTASRSGTGRILSLRPNAQFSAWLIGHLSRCRRRRQRRRSQKP